MSSQDSSGPHYTFAHLGMPIKSITQYGPCASAVILGQRHIRRNIRFEGLAEALDAPQTQVRLFDRRR
ncbi:hypothetical protein O9993_08005 [Vibrio lentus]|nr:hypothetical protein [Vibrio lentus]